jgi:hypothetical protein
MVRKASSVAPSHNPEGRLIKPAIERVLLAPQNLPLDCQPECECSAYEGDRNRSVSHCRLWPEAIHTISIIELRRVIRLLRTFRIRVSGISSMRRSAAAVLCRLTKGHERAHSKRPESFLLATRECSSFWFLWPLSNGRPLSFQWYRPLMRPSAYSLRFSSAIASRTMLGSSLSTASR